MIGRLREGVTLKQAQPALTRLAAQLAEAYPETNAGLGIDLRPASTVPGQFRGALVGFMVILMFVVGLVLLIACANVGAMLLALATSRRREIAIRLAVGASRWRIVRQLLVESVVLFVIGGGSGVLIAVWATSLMQNIKPPAEVPIAIDLSVDLRVLLFTLLLSLVTGLLFGLAPALQASKPDVLAALKSDAPGGTHRSRLRNVFVVAQIAISLVLLVTAGLFLRSLRNASSIDLGFAPAGVQTITLDLKTQGYDEKKGREFYRQLVERTASLPGVRAVSLARIIPLNGSNMKVGVSLPGRDQPGRGGAGVDDAVGLNVVDARY
jgi:predicted permease